MPTALTTYRPALPAVPLNPVERLGSAVLRTLDRAGVGPGTIGVVFNRVRLHRGQFVSYSIDARILSATDQRLILSNDLRSRLSTVLQKQVAITRAEQAMLIVIDLRQTRRQRLSRWRHTHFNRSGRQ